MHRQRHSRRFKSLPISRHSTTAVFEIHRIGKENSSWSSPGERSADPRYRGLGPVLIVCPSTLLHQWVHEFQQWWPEFRVAVLHESGSFQGKKGVRSPIDSDPILKISLEPFDR